MVLRSNLLKKWIEIIFSLKFLVQMQPKLMSCFMSQLEKKQKLLLLGLLHTQVVCTFSLFWGHNLLGSERLTGENDSDSKLLTRITKAACCSIDLSRVHSIAGPIPKEIGGLHKLVEFQLEGNSLINGSIPKEIGNMTALTYLYLQDMSLSGTHLLFHLFNYHNLRVALIHLIVSVPYPIQFHICHAIVHNYLP